MSSPLYVRSLESNPVHFKHGDGGGLRIEVWAMIGGRARLTTTDGITVFDAWCYDDPAVCLRAAAAWSGEGDPADGWTRHVNSGRRRIAGDPTKETRYW